MIFMFSFKKILFLLLLFIFSLSLFSQGEFSLTREPDRYNLNTYGIKLNSNGFGVNYSFQMRKHYRLRRVIEAEYNYLFDFKEVKVVNQVYSIINQKSFVFGKINSVHNLKFAYGYKRMFFEKRDDNSVSIHLLASLGLSLCFSKPIYYQKYNSSTYEIRNERFDITAANGNYDIIGKSSFLIGLSETTVQPGICGKIGLEFDFAKDIMRSSVLSLGGQLDAYVLKVEIMAEHARYIIPSFYVMYSFGNKYNSALNREYRKSQRKLK